MSGDARQHAEPPAARCAGRSTSPLAVVFAIACALPVELAVHAQRRSARRSSRSSPRTTTPSPSPLDELIPPGGDARPGRPVAPGRASTGTYLADEQLLARNRPHGGTAAFEVLVPFRLDDGRVLLIDRGWVPPGEHQPDPDVVPAAPEGEVTVIVRLRPGEALPASGRSAPDGPGADDQPRPRRRRASTPRSATRSSRAPTASWSRRIRRRRRGRTRSSRRPKIPVRTCRTRSSGSSSRSWASSSSATSSAPSGATAAKTPRTRRRHAAPPRPRRPARRRDRDAEDEDALLDARRVRR